MAQPGTGAQAMERPVQSAVFALENTVAAREPEASPDSREVTAPQPAEAGVADLARF